jgi:hypothetical protein
MKVPRDYPRTKQVESSIKLATLTVTNVTLVRIVLKLKLSFIRLSMIIYLTWDPKNDTSTIKVISSPYDSHRGIWVPKHFLSNHEGPNKAWVPKLS